MAKNISKMLNTKQVKFILIRINRFLFNFFWFFLWGCFFCRCFRGFLVLVLILFLLLFLFRFNFWCGWCFFNLFSFCFNLFFFNGGRNISCWFRVFTFLYRKSTVSLRLISKYLTVKNKKKKIFSLIL